MVMKVLIALVLVVIVFLGYVAIKPADFRLERSVSIKAPAQIIFPHVNDLHKFDEWNPWSKQDPNIKMSYEGPHEGVGARASWEGNSQVGQGSMTVVESQPDTLVRLQLDFKKPFPATNMAEFTFKPEGDHTVVSWSMSGKMHFIPRAISVFLDMDKMMGAEFEKGLAQLKSISESEAK